MSRAGADSTGWLALARVQLRTARAQLVAWPVVIVALVASTAWSIASVYDTPARRATYATTVSDSAVGLAFNGRGYALDTVGGIVAVEIGIYALLVFPMIAAHLAIRLTRSEEAAGRLELLSARRLGRSAPLRAATLTTTAALLTAGGLTWLGLVGTGLPASRSALYSAGLTMMLLAFAGVGLVAAQLGIDGRSAHTIALATVGVLFMVRAVIDVRRWPATWLTPTGWLAEVRAFDRPQLWPFIAFGLLWIVLLAIARTLNARRDVGAGLVKPRPGLATAAASLATPAGLVRRLTRTSWIGWVASSMLWAFSVGVVAKEMRSLVESNPDIAVVLGPAGTEPELLMLALGAVFVALLAVGYAATAVMSLAGEESTDRLGLILSSRVSRVAWWRGAMITLAGHATAAVLLGGLALGVGAAIGLGQPGRLWGGLWWSAIYLPAVLLASSIAALAVAVSPAGRSLGWALFGWMLTVAMLAETLRMPRWLRNTSPFEHVPRLPAVRPAVVDVVVPLAVLTGLAVVVAGAAAAILTRRDIGSHSRSWLRLPHWRGVQPG